MIDDVFVALGDVYPYLVAGFVVDSVFRVGGKGRLVLRRVGASAIVGVGWHLVGLTPRDRGYAVRLPRTLEGDDRWTFTRASGRDTDRFDPESYTDAPVEHSPRESVISFDSFRQRRETIGRAERASTRASAAAFVVGLTAMPASLYVVPRDVPGVFECSLAIGIVTHIVAYVLAWRLVAALRTAAVRIPPDTIVALAIYAPTTHHAATRLMRYAYEDVDPHLVAAATFDEPRRSAVIRRELWGATVARARSSDDLWQRLWHDRERRMRSAAEALGIDPDTVMRVPDLANDVRGWCPACGAAFRMSVDGCPDCAMPVLDASCAGTSLTDARLHTEHRAGASRPGDRAPYSPTSS